MSDAGLTGPAQNPLGGTQVGTTGIWAGDYTVQPENGGLSTIAHEYGHDLGLPDHYDTAGGQNGVDAEGRLVDGGLYEQALQAYRNLEAVLAEGGAGLTDVVHWRISVVAGQDVMDGVRAFQEVWPGGEPPAISVNVVGEARPGLLCEIDAVAVI